MPAPCALPSYLPALPARPGPGRAHPSPAPAPHPVASHRVRPPCRGPRWPSSNRDSLACSSVVPAQVYAPPINILPPFLPHAPYWGLLWPLRTTLTNQPKLPRPAEPCRPEQPRGARSRGSPQPSRATQLILQAGDLRLEEEGRDVCRIWVLDKCRWMVSSTYNQPQRAVMAQRPCSASMGVIDSFGPLPGDPALRSLWIPLSASSASSSPSPAASGP